MARTDLKSDLSLLFVVLVWGINFVVLKAALDAMPPHALNVFRFTVSVLVLGALYAARQRREGEPFAAPLRRYVWPIAGLGLLSFFFYQLCFIIGVDHTTAGNAALIMASAPLWTAVFGHVLRLDFINGAAWLGLGVTFAGAAVIVVGGAKAIDFSNATFFGNVMMLGGAVLWGAYTALTKPMAKRVSPIGLSFLGLVFAFPLLVGVGVLDFDEVAWAQIDAWVWVAIVFSGGLSTGLAVALWNAAIKQVGPSQTAAYGNLVPVVALVSGVLFLGESVTIIQLLGGALILGGLFLTRRQRRAAQAASV